MVLISNTTYFCSATACNSVSCSTYTPLGSTITLAAAPAALDPTVAATQITLNWGASGNLAGTPYLVQLDTDPAFGSSISSATLALSAIFTGLSSDTTYYSRARAANAAGINTAFTVLSATVTLPFAPSAAALSGVTTGQVQANWEANGNAAGIRYTAVLSTGALPNSFSGNLTSSTLDTSALFAGLGANATVYAMVRAENRAGSPSAFTALGSTPTLAEAPTASATNPVLASSFTANWGTAGNPAGTLYVAEAGLDAAFGSLGASSATRSASAGFTGLTANTTWYVRVRAFNHAGIPTAYSANVSTLTYAAAPTAGPFASSSTAVGASWLANGNADGTVYTVILSTGTSPSSNGFSGDVSSTTLNLFAVFSALAPSTVYYLEVKAVGRRGESTAFIALGAAQTAPGPPPAPGAGEGITAVGDRNLTAAWSPVAGAQQYQLVASTSSANPPDPGATFQIASSTSDTASGLTPNTSYYAFVAACNSLGCSSYVSLGSTVTLAGLPSQLQPAPSTAAVTAFWGPNGNPAGTQFSVELSTDPAFSPAASSATVGAQAAFTALTPNTTYYSRIRAVSYNGVFTAYKSLPEAVTLAAVPATGAVSGVTTSALQSNWGAGGNPSGTRYLRVASTGASPGSNGFTGNVSSRTTGLTASSSGLTPNTSYWIEVQAINHDDRGTDFADLGSTLTYAAAPAALGAVAQSSLTLTTQWSASGNPSDTLYEAHLSTDAAFSALAASSSLTGTQALFQGLAASTTYYFRVRAVDRAGRATSFAVAGATQTAPTKPGSPILAGFAASSATIRWTLTNVGSASSGFTLYTDTGAVVAALGGSATDYLEAGLSTGTRYSRYLRAVNESGPAESSTITVATPHLTSFVTGVASGTLTGTNGKTQLDFPNNNLALDTRWLVSETPATTPLTDAAPALITAANTAKPSGLRGAESSVTEFLVVVGGVRYTANFASALTVRVPYPDADSNDLVDGSAPAVRAETLKLYVLNEASRNWDEVPGSTVDKVNKVVTAQVSHLSIFTAFGVSAASDLSKARVYPNPYRPNGGNPDFGQAFAAGNMNSGIIFDQLTDEVAIRIYTVSGRLVAEMKTAKSSGKLQWDARNTAGEDVASGGYVALIESPSVEKTVRKILILR